MGRSIAVKRRLAVEAAVQRAFRIGARFRDILHIHASPRNPEIRLKQRRIAAQPVPRVVRNCASAKGRQGWISGMHRHPNGQTEL